MVVVNPRVVGTCEERVHGRYTLLFLCLLPLPYCERKESKIHVVRIPSHKSRVIGVYPDTAGDPRSGLLSKVKSKGGEGQSFNKGLSLERDMIDFPDVVCGISRYQVRSSDVVESGDVWRVRGVWGRLVGCSSHPLIHPGTKVRPTPRSRRA